MAVRRFNARPSADYSTASPLDFDDSNTDLKLIVLAAMLETLASGTRRVMLVE